MTNGSDKKGLITIGGNDTRVTQSGIYLRKFKLDEIPQLFNVLIGDMSLVGPRPEVSKYVSIYESEYSYLLKVRPGITSPASLHFSNENELLSEVDNPTEYYEKAILPQKIDLDKSCVNDRGVRNYFSIIFETINKLIGGNK
jgi:lipopolysaccharide/colanic/teichoic acid biosynthesis glycosyltransferase